MASASPWMRRSSLSAARSSRMKRTRKATSQSTPAIVVAWMKLDDERLVWLVDGLAGIPTERIEQWRADKAHYLSQALLDPVRLHPQPFAPASEGKRQWRTRTGGLPTPALVLTAGVRRPEERSCPLPLRLHRRGFYGRERRELRRQPHAEPQARLRAGHDRGRDGM